MTKKKWLISASLAISTLYAEKTHLLSVDEMLNGQQDFNAVKMLQDPSVEIEAKKGELTTSGAEQTQILPNAQTTQVPFVTSQTEEAQRTISGFTVSDALDFAQAADLAYKNKKKVGNLPVLMQAAGFSAFHSLEGGLDNSGFVGVRQDGSIVVSFTGTTGLKNVLTDLWFNWAFDHENGGRYHNGIMIAFRSLEAQLKAVLNTIAAERNQTLQELFSNVHFTGHSLGAGMALLGADVFRRQGCFAKGVIAFAAPRVMDMVTATEYNNQMCDRTLVVKQITDPVPVMSPGFVMGSKQVGQQLVLPYHLATLQHKLGGYIEALQIFKASRTGEIEVSQFTLWGLRNPTGIYKFEADATKDSVVSTVVKSALTSIYRPIHRIGLDTMEGARLVYANAPILTSAVTWTANTAFSALSYSAKTVYSTAAWGYKAYTDGTKTTQEKVVEAVQNIAHTVSEVVKSVVDTVETAVRNIAPTAVKALGWFASKIWTRTTEFVRDAKVLLGH